jgi:hypothetical protein
MTTQSAASSCNATKNKERLIQEINELMKIFRAILEKVKHNIKEMGIDDFRYRRNA